MKTKRFLSLLLALVMSFALAVPAFAAEPDDGDPNEGIMLLDTLYWGRDITIASGEFRSTNFISVPGNGKYVKVWYANKTNYSATVHLCRADTDEVLASKVVSANSNTNNVIWWEGSNTEPITYYVVVVEHNHYPIDGYLSVAQYVTKD